MELHSPLGDRMTLWIHERRKPGPWKKWSLVRLSDEAGRFFIRLYHRADGRTVFMDTHIFRDESREWVSRWLMVARNTLKSRSMWPKE